MDKTLLNDATQPKAGVERPTPSPMPPPTTPEGVSQGASSADRQPTTPKTENGKIFCAHEINYDTVKILIRQKKTWIVNIITKNCCASNRWRW
jgi:hypothetical protein